MKRRPRWPRLQQQSPGQLLHSAVRPCQHNGNRLATLDLSGQYESIQAVRGAGDRVYLGVQGRGEKNACTYALVEWTVGP
ncbi:MAG TPA: hypothetical protein VJG32_18900 [Anaerolineae bacterium]|nr:hypothetical protein [Anaerolineae bacterium]